MLVQWRRATFSYQTRISYRAWLIVCSVALCVHMKNFHNMISEQDMMWANGLTDDWFVQCDAMIISVCDKVLDGYDSINLMNHWMLKDCVIEWSKHWGSYIYVTNGNLLLLNPSVNVYCFIYDLLDSRLCYWHILNMRASLLCFWLWIRILEVWIVEQRLKLCMRLQCLGLRA